MAFEDDIRETRALEEQLQTTLNRLPAGAFSGEQIVRKRGSWNTADYIERVLEGGKKTMGRTDLVKTLVEQKMVGGKDDDQREQYANEAIKRGVMFGYLKEARDGTIHWIPDVRKPRVGKKL
jgi:hypothetical protein